MIYAARSPSITKIQLSTTKLYLVIYIFLSQTVHFQQNDFVYNSLAKK